MTYSTVYKEREGCNDRIINDLRAGKALSGGMVVTLKGAQVHPATVNDDGFGCVGNYFNSGELVDIERDGRFNVKAAETLGAGWSVCPGANGTVERATTTRVTNGARRIGFMVEDTASGAYGAMEIISC
jgi:hypothetical protein